MDCSKSLLSISLLVFFQTEQLSQDGAQVSGPNMEVGEQQTDSLRLSFHFKFSSESTQDGSEF